MRFRSWLAIAVLLALPVSAWSQVVVNDGASTRQQTGTLVVGGILRADTTGRALTFDSDGNLLTKEQAPLTTANAIHSSIISASLAAAAADSSDVITVRGLRHMKLLIKAVPGGTGAQGTIVKMAVQVRTHLNGVADSSSTFAEYPLTMIATLNSATAADTLSLGHLAIGSATVPWSGEFLVQTNNNRNAPGNAVAAILFHYPNGAAISLDNVYGRDFWADYLSVRVRNIHASVACVVSDHAASPFQNTGTLF